MSSVRSTFLLRIFNCRFVLPLFYFIPFHSSHTLTVHCMHRVSHNCREFAHCSRFRGDFCMLLCCCNKTICDDFFFASVCWSIYATATAAAAAATRSVYVYLFNYLIHVSYCLVCHTAKRVAEPTRIKSQGKCVHVKPATQWVDSIQTYWFFILSLFFKRILFVSDWWPK